MQRQRLFLFLALDVGNLEAEAAIATAPDDADGLSSSVAVRIFSSFSRGSASEVAIAPVKDISSFLSVTMPSAFCDDLRSSPPASGP
jgi:hypothetical protein